VKLDLTVEDRQTNRTAGRSLDTNPDIEDKLTIRALSSDSNQTTPITSSEIAHETTRMEPLAGSDQTVPLSSVPAPKFARPGRLVLAMGLVFTLAIAAAVLIVRHKEANIAALPSEEPKSKAPPPPKSPTELKPEAMTPAQGPESRKKTNEALHQTDKPHLASPTESSPPEATTSSAADLVKLGIEHFGKKQYNLALNAFQEASKLDPSNQDIYYLMGLTYEKLGRPDSALESYQRCQSGAYAHQARQHVERLSKRLK
jgi:tetratricopeptide (TPR) repeat protein